MAQVGVLAHAVPPGQLVHRLHDGHARSQREGRDRRVQAVEPELARADEAMIALNIERRSYAELFGTLDFNQAAPLGFLWLEKAAVQLLGPSELALRLWPLLAGIAALFPTPTPP